MNVEAFARVFFVAAVLNFIGSSVLAQQPTHQARVRGIGIAVFFGLFAVGLFDDGGAELAVARIIQSLLIAWCVTGVLSIVIPAYLVVYNTVVLLPLRIFNDAYRSFAKVKQQRRLERAKEIQRIRADEAWERDRPERERLAKIKSEADERARTTAEAEARNRASEQQRRQEARFRCRLLFDRHYGDIKESLSRKRFQLYLDQELSDQYPADIVETNATKLSEMILDFFEKSEPQHDFPSVDALRDRFDHERQQIEESNFDEETKASMLAQLNWEEDHAANRMNRK